MKTTPLLARALRFVYPELNCYFCVLSLILAIDSGTLALQVKDMERIHATTVALAGKAVLLRGDSGSGKSDLALRLIDAGWDLVADDYTEIEALDNTLFAHAPKSIEGLIEVRGLGVLRLGCVARAEVSLIFDLVPRATIERLPAFDFETLQGITIPRHDLVGLEPSALAKVRMTMLAHTENLFHESMGTGDD